MKPQSEILNDSHDNDSDDNVQYLCAKITKMMFELLIDGEKT